jgi:D-beta-D-heptose 7-phosphate kinase/D-beta-D-heptose 1-phosphate adenosyltransferase
LAAESRSDLFKYLADMADEVDAVIIADYGKGVITQDLMDRVREIYLGLNKIIAVDPKVNNFKLYEKVTVMTPNHHEAGLGAGFKIDSEETLLRAGRILLDDLKCRSVLVTRGEQGMTLFEGTDPPRHIPTMAREVFDVTGAGDTVIAIMTLGLAAGLGFPDAAVLSNVAAGVVVGEVGTSTVTAEKLKNRIMAGARGFTGYDF